MSRYREVPSTAYCCNTQTRKYLGQLNATKCPFSCCFLSTESGLQGCEDTQLHPAPTGIDFRQLHRPNQFLLHLINTTLSSVTGISKLHRTRYTTYFLNFHFVKSYRPRESLPTEGLPLKLLGCFQKFGNYLLLCLFPDVLVSISALSHPVLSAL